MADRQQETVLLRSAGNDVRRLPELAAELIALDVGVLIAVAVTTTRGTLAIEGPRTYRTKDQPATDVFDCMERFYNPRCHICECHCFL